MLNSVQDACRVLVPTNRILVTALGLCFFNYILLSVQYNLQEAYCSSREAHGRSKRSYDTNDSRRWKVKEANEYWLVEIAKHSTFDWEDEIVSLMHVLPALEKRTTGDADDADAYIYEPADSPSQWAQGLDKSPVLPLVTERIKENHVANEIKKFNENKNELAATVGVGKLMGCKQLAKLESSRVEPRIKYTFRSVSGWKGTYSPTKTDSIPIVVRRFERKKAPPKSTNEKSNYLWLARNENPYFDKDFERVKKEILTLLRIQGWYGVPKLFAVCMSTSNGEDITDAILNHAGEKRHLEASAIRYMISRNGDGARMCDSYYATDDCHRVHSILSLVHESTRPAVAAIKVMLNTAKLFAQFYENRAVLYELIGTDFYVDSNYDVFLNDISTVKFLPRNTYSQNSQFQRLLSGTICTIPEQCVPVTWQASSISYKFGLHCREIKGYCTDENRCWGIDSQSHACVLSRWFFGRLHSAIPVSWSRDGDLTKLLQCASAQSPEERCTWTQIRDTLSEMLQNAQQEWPEHGAFAP